MRDAQIKVQNTKHFGNGPKPKERVAGRAIYQEATECAAAVNTNKSAHKLDAKFDRCSFFSDSCMTVNLIFLKNQFFLLRYY